MSPCDGGDADRQRPLSSGTFREVQGWVSRVEAFRKRLAPNRASDGTTVMKATAVQGLLETPAWNILPQRATHTIAIRRIQPIQDISIAPRALVVAAR